MPSVKVRMGEPIDKALRALKKKLAAIRAKADAAKRQKQEKKVDAGQEKKT